MNNTNTQLKDVTGNTMLKIETLQKEYDVLLSQYQEAMNNYIKSLSSNENPCATYASNNKNISQVCYDKIWHEQGCLSNAPSVETTQSLNELVNNAHDISISNNEADIKTCYGNNIPTKAIIQNNNFDQPLLENGTSEHITSETKVPNWNLNRAVLLNEAEVWNYPIPYPKGKQCICLQNDAYISQNVNLKENINYTISLLCCGRNCCDGVNKIKIELYSKADDKIKEIYEIIPVADIWNEYTAIFSAPTSDEYKIRIKGTNTTGAIQNIYLKYDILPIYPNISEYISLIGKMWKGSDEEIVPNITTENECIALCESNEKCVGATFNPTRKICSIKNGDPVIKNGMMDDKNKDNSDYAIIKKIKYDALILKSLNKKLVELNEQIAKEISSIEPTMQSFENKQKYNKQKLETQFKLLLEHENEIKTQLKDYSDIEDKYDNSSIYVNQQHMMYNIFGILSLVIVLITSKKIMESESNLTIIILMSLIWGFYYFIIQIYKK